MQDCQQQSPDWKISAQHMDHSNFKSLTENQMRRAVEWVFQNKRSAHKSFIYIFVIFAAHFHNYCLAIQYRDSKLKWAEDLEDRNEECLLKFKNSIDSGILFIISIHL